MRESHPQRPISPYGVSKKAAGDYLHYYREVHGLEYTELALANVYGPRQDPNGEAGVVAIFAGRMLAGRQPTVFGDGAQTRDFVFVDDVVDAFVRATEKGGGLLMNIGTGVETSVLELYDADGRASPGTRSRRTVRRARAGELLRSALDPGRAAIHLGLEAVDRRSTTASRAPSTGSESRRRPAIPSVTDPTLPDAATRRQRKARRSSSGTGGRGRPTYAGSGRPTSTIACGSHSGARASASRAASGQKIGAATQHDASPASAAATMKFSTAAPSESSAMPHSARWRVSSG